MKVEIGEFRFHGSGLHAGYLLNRISQDSAFGYVPGPNNLEFLPCALCLTVCWL